MGWALDGGEDIGGHFADIDFIEKSRARLESIKADRKRRGNNLVGKYVVVTEGKSSGKLVFYQIKQFNAGCYWTQFLTNAVGFERLELANRVKSKFQFGNPRVALVTAEGQYQFID